MKKALTTIALIAGLTNSMNAGEIPYLRPDSELVKLVQEKAKSGIFDSNKKITRFSQDGLTYNLTLNEKDNTLEFTMGRCPKIEISATRCDWYYKLKYNISQNQITEASGFSKKGHQKYTREKNPEYFRIENFSNDILTATDYLREKTQIAQN